MNACPEFTTRAHVLYGVWLLALTHHQLLQEEYIGGAEDTMEGGEDECNR